MLHPEISVFPPSQCTYLVCHPFFSPLHIIKSTNCFVPFLLYWEEEMIDWLVQTHGAKRNWSVSVCGSVALKVYSGWYMWICAHGSLCWEELIYWYMCIHGIEQNWLIGLCGPVALRVYSHWCVGTFATGSLCWIDLLDWHVRIYAESS